MSATERVFFKFVSFDELELDTVNFIHIISFDNMRISNSAVNLVEYSLMDYLNPTSPSVLP